MNVYCLFREKISTLHYNNLDPMYPYCIVIMFMPFIIKTLKLYTLCFWPILALFWSSLRFNSVRTMWSYTVHSICAPCWGNSRSLPWVQRGGKHRSRSVQPLQYKHTAVSVLLNMFHGRNALFSMKLRTKKLETLCEMKNDNGSKVNLNFINWRPDFCHVTYSIKLKQS